jgi:hypothetical protein
MISILLLSIILVAIAAVLLYQARTVLDYKIAALENKLASVDSKNQIVISAYEDLDKANLHYQLLNKKLSNELQLWKYRRKLLDNFPVSYRKKKVRGKRRKGRRQSE